MKRFKTFTLRVIAGANVAIVLIMLLLGYSGCFNPVEHPILACSTLLFPVFLVINLLFLVFWLFFYWRGAIIPFVGYLICYFPIRTYIPFNIVSEPPEGAIKVVSYNVAGYGYGVLGLPNDEPSEVVSWLIDSDADIICIQEGGISAADARVNDVLKKKYEFSKEEVKDKGTALSLFSRFPILKSEFIEYESKGNASVAFEIDYHGKEVVIINNHLESNGLSMEVKQNFKQMVKGDLTAEEAKGESRVLFDRLRDAVRKRAPQAEAVAAYIAKCRDEGKSVIVCGDFNDNPISYTHRTIAKDLTDCYVSSGKGPGWSYARGGMRVRIDNILCSDEWEPYGAKVDTKVTVSDHYPVYCWLKMK